MREHGRAQISARHPRALGICDRCGFMYNLDQLTWQWDWEQGPRLFNKRILVCQPCYDKPQESGRTVVLPPDPIPVQNARPEVYALADSPISGLLWSPANNFIPGSSLGGAIGNMTLNGGIDAAFFVNDGSTTTSTSVTGLFQPSSSPAVNKRYAFSAALAVSNSSFNNYVGKNWSVFPSGATIGSTFPVPTYTHIASGFSAFAPSDQSFLRGAGTGWRFEGSADGATWTTLASGTTAGVAGETVTSLSTFGAAYQYHRFNIQGDGISQVGIAGLSISISDAAPNDI